MNDCFTKVLKESVDANLPYYGVIKVKFTPDASNYNVNVKYDESGKVSSTVPFVMNSVTYTEVTISGDEKTLQFTNQQETEVTFDKYKVNTLYFNSGIPLIDFDTEILENSSLKKLFVMGDSSNQAFFDFSVFSNMVQLRYLNTNTLFKDFDIQNFAVPNPNITEVYVMADENVHGSLESYLEKMLASRTVADVLKFDVRNSGIKFNNEAIHWDLRVIFTSTTITVKSSDQTVTYGTYTQGSGWSY